MKWARKPIEVLASKGIINGTSKDTFSPAVNITRADYLVLLAKTLGLMADFDENFDDVEPGSYYYEAVGIAKNLGIAAGSGNNRFNPKENISRQDMMVLMKRALEVTGQDEKFITNNGKKISDFNNNKEVASYAKDSVEYLISKGIVNGTGKNINPTNDTKRAEVAALLYKVLGILNK